METGPDYESSKNHVYENGTLGIFDSVSFLPFPLHELFEAFGLTATKSWCHHYFNTEKT